MEPVRATRVSTSQSLERGLAILSSFSAGRQLIGVSEIAQELGLTRSTAHRYIATLARLGYLHQDAATRKYALGPRVLDLGFTAINSMELRHVAAPHLQRLCDETGHTVNLAILDDVDIVYVERFRASRRHQNQIDLDLHVGSRLPAYCTSLGKVLLAFLPDSERDDVLDRTTFARRGPNTLHVEDRAARRPPAHSRDGHRGQQRGARVRAPIRRRPGLLRRRRGRRSVESGGAPDDGLAGRPHRTAGADHAAHRCRDLRAARLPRHAGDAPHHALRPRVGPGGSVARRGAAHSREGPGSTAGFRRRRATTRLPSAATAWTTPRLKPRKMAITKTP